MNENVEPWHPEAAAFYRKRGLSHSTVHRFGLGRVRSGRYGGRLAIPYSDGQYRVRAVRYRSLDRREPKYLNPAGQKTHLFAVRASDEAVVVITEGEIDACSSWQCGIKAVGVPGAMNWQPYWAWLFRNCDRVIVAFDMDEAGQRGAHKVMNSLKHVGVDAERAELPEGMDVNDVLVKHGASAVREVLRGA